MTLTQQMHRSLFFLLLLFCVVFNDANGDELRVGALLNLTGFGARWGEEARRGIVLAQEELGSSGAGKPTIRVLFEDTRSGNPAAITSAVKRLLTIEKVDILLTQWTADTEIAWALAAPKGIPTITVSGGAPGLLENRPLLFSLWGDDGALMEAVVDALLTKGVSRPLLVAAQDPYFIALLDHALQLLRRRQISALHLSGILPDASLINEAVRSREMNPDAIVSLLPLPQQADLVRRIRAMKMQVPFFGIVGSDETLFRTLAGAASTGVVIPFYAESSAWFKSRYLQRWGEKPWLASDTAYDAVLFASLAYSALRRSSSVGNLVSALQSIRQFEGASGSVIISKQGLRVNRAVHLMTLAPPT